MIVKLLTEHHWSFQAYKEATEARLSLHLSNATLLEITCHGSNCFKHKICFVNKPYWEGILEVT